MGGSDQKEGCEAEAQKSLTAPISDAEIIPMDHLLDATLPPTTASVQQAHLLVDAELHRCGLHAVRDPAALVVAELVGNVIQHTHSDFRLELETSGVWLHIRVSDRSPYPAEHREPDSHEGGWGLRIVADIADDWGAHTTFDGKTVWATLSVEHAATQGLGTRSR